MTRGKQGEDHWHAKLSEDDVIEIRKQYADGELQVNIAAYFKISKSLVNKIVKKKLWKDL